MSVTPSIIGHQKAITGLRRAIERETLHHAYLFEGPKGLGKGTVALYLAMTLNCESEDTPCGTCDPCRHIAAETHPDIIHLRPNAERASRTISVEAVREVVRQTGYHHYSAKHRVVIIDPAEAMPASAANALLKTLEEPPAGTTFVLIATHARALLPTIVSRCQRMRFSPLDNRDLSTWLQQLGVENPLPYVRRSEGCPGRALSLLDGGLEARNETRDTLLGLLEQELSSIYDWSTKLCNGDRQKWMPHAEVYLEVTEDLLRDVVIRGSASSLEPINGDIPEVITNWSRRLWPTGVAGCVAVIETTRDNLFANVTGKTAMDTFIVQLAQQLGYRN